MSGQTVRRGFTLIELLVVVFIIGVLVALLLPAIQAAREAARKAACKNNLRQLALAAITHHEQIGWFPTGGWSAYWVGDKDRGFGEEQPGGWAYNILPFIEAEALHDQPSDGITYQMTAAQRAGAKLAVESPIAVITCPSRRPPGIYPISFDAVNSDDIHAGGHLDYAFNYGSSHYQRFYGPAPPAIPPIWQMDRYPVVNVDQGFEWDFDATGVSLRDWRISGNGISFVRSKVAVRHITDGASKTYMVGEKARSDSVPYESGTRGDRGTWLSGYSANGNRGGFLPAIHDSDDYRHRLSDYTEFGSAHRSGLHMAYCDGSVRVVSYDVDLPVHQAAANRYDGQVFGN